VLNINIGKRRGADVVIAVCRVREKERLSRAQPFLFNWNVFLFWRGTIRGLAKFLPAKRTTCVIIMVKYGEKKGPVK
jgi:hypothetical protein